MVIDDADEQSGVALVEMYDADGDEPIARLVNISTRGHVGVGDSIMIPGFVISGTSKTLLIRAVGPSLARPPFLVAAALVDPMLSIYRRVPGSADQLILSNDNWNQGGDPDRTRSVAAQVHAFSLLEQSRDAAVVVTLPPGIYTVHARGMNNSTGVALVELYEVPAE